MKSKNKPAKDFFKDETMIILPEDGAVTRKKAKINVSGYPRLEVHGKSKTLSNKSFSIGRDKGNTLIIADTQVSKFHAMVTFTKGVGYLMDTNSTNGTFLNGKRLPSNKKIKLNNGDKIKVGTTQIVYYK